MATLLHLPKSHVLSFVEQIKTHSLRVTSPALPVQRYNVLQSNIHKTDLAALDEKIRIFLSPGNGEFNPSTELWVTMGYSAISAVFSHLVEGEKEWAYKDLSMFNRRFLGKLLSEAKKCKVLGVAFPPGKMPSSKIAKTGLYLRLCSMPWDDNQGISSSDVETLLRATLERFWKIHSVPKQIRMQKERIVACLRSIVPLPHNEIYQSYSEDGNHIGMYQDALNETLRWTRSTLAPFALVRLYSLVPHLLPVALIIPVATICTRAFPVACLSRRSDHAILLAFHGNLYHDSAPTALH